VSKKKQWEPELPSILLETAGEHGFLEIKPMGDGLYSFVVGNNGAYLWTYTGTPDELIAFLEKAALQLWDNKVNTLIRADWGSGIVAVVDINPYPMWEEKYGPPTQLADGSWIGFYDTLTGAKQSCKASDIRVTPDGMRCGARPEKLDGKWSWVVRSKSIQETA
jgi:hypothetical protein